MSNYNPSCVVLCIHWGLDCEKYYIGQHFILGNVVYLQLQISADVKTIWKVAWYDFEVMCLK